MKQTRLLLLLLFSFSSCGVYRSSFDCPPCRGLGCISVGEVLDLIVENEEGEDFLVKDQKEAIFLKKQEKKEPKKNCMKCRQQETVFRLVKNDAGEYSLAEEKE